MKYRRFCHASFYGMNAAYVKGGPLGSSILVERCGTNQQKKPQIREISAKSEAI